MAEVFDALTSRRAYKPAFPVEKAFDIFREGRGDHFDPRVLDAFLDSREAVIAVPKELGDVATK